MEAAEEGEVPRYQRTEEMEEMPLDLVAGAVVEGLAQATMPLYGQEMAVKEQTALWLLHPTSNAKRTDRNNNIYRRAIG